MRTAAAVLLLVVLTACGGGSDSPSTTPTTSRTATTKAPVEPTTAPTTGTPAPEALSRFQCRQDDKGRWGATGYVTNSGKAKVTYQVTVYVGEVTGGGQRGKTKQLASVAGGGSVRFAISVIPAPKDGGTCHVQVLASP